MKPGDKVKVRNHKDDSYEVYMVLEVRDRSDKLKHPTIGGYIVFSKEMVLRV